MYAAKKWIEGVPVPHAFKEYPGALHDLLGDPEQESQVFADMVEFFKQHTT